MASAAFVVVLLVLGVGAYHLSGGDYWLARPATATDVAAAPEPADAPALGSCWRVTPALLLQPMPWPADAAVTSCNTLHSGEVFHVDRVDPALVLAAARARGAAVTEHRARMSVQARRACSTLASRYLGGAWRGGRIRVHMAWLRPERNGYFTCTLVFTDDPAGRYIGNLRGNLLGGLGGGRSSSRVAIDCASDGRFIGCANVHDWEFAGLYAVTPLGGTFDAAAVTEGCAGVVQAYVGAARDDLRVRFVGPSDPAEWAGSDQTFACYAVVREGRLAGSLKGLGAGPLPHR
jgi:hypothetical protein